MEDGDSKTGYTSTNEYLAKSGGKYAKSVAHPLNYSFVFVLAMVREAGLLDGGTVAVDSSPLEANAAMK